MWELPEKKEFSFQVSHQLGNLMDIFSTLLDLAEVPGPKDRIIDGVSLKALILNGTQTDR